jgi:AcrR family transcriptional regulator
MNMFTFVSTRPRTTAKAERTRERILSVALENFVARGYEATTLRDVAAAAGCSVGLTYRYFRSKEALVQALYADLASAFVARAEHLPAGSVGDRFRAAMGEKIEVARPYRSVLGALFASAMDPSSPVAVFGEHGAAIRARVAGVFRSVVVGAADAPPEPLASDLTTMLYAAHLAIVLLWLHDKTRGEHSTRLVIDLVASALRQGLPLLATPGLAQPMADLSGAIGSMVAGTGAAAQGPGPRSSKSSRR